MKNLITIMIMLVAVGCGKTETERLESEKLMKEIQSELADENKKLKDENEQTLQKINKCGFGKRSNS